MEEQIRGAEGGRKRMYCVLYAFCARQQVTCIVLSRIFVLRVINTLTRLLNYWSLAVFYNNPKDKRCKYGAVVEEIPVHIFTCMYKFSLMYIHFSDSTTTLFLIWHKFCNKPHKFDVCDKGEKLTCEICTKNKCHAFFTRSWCPNNKIRIQPINFSMSCGKLCVSKLGNIHIVQNKIIKYVQVDEVILVLVLLIAQS